MSDLSITAGSVISDPTAKRVLGTAGAVITAGKAVYLDETTNTYKNADADSATAAARSPAGIALNGASSGQPLVVHERGLITIGAAVTQGVAYYLSPTAGGICPVADVLTGDYPVFLGFAVNATQIDIDIKEAGVVL